MPKSGLLVQLCGGCHPNDTDACVDHVCEVDGRVVDTRVPPSSENVAIRSMVPMSQKLEFLNSQLFWSLPQ